MTVILLVISQRFLKLFLYTISFTYEIVHKKLNDVMAILSKKHCALIVEYTSSMVLENFILSLEIKAFSFENLIVSFFVEI